MKSFLIVAAGALVLSAKFLLQRGGRSSEVKPNQDDREEPTERKSEEETDPSPPQPQPSTSETTATTSYTKDPPSSPAQISSKKPTDSVKDYHYSTRQEKHINQDSETIQTETPSCIQNASSSSDLQTKNHSPSTSFQQAHLTSSPFEKYRKPQFSGPVFFPLPRRASLDSTLPSLPRSSATYHYLSCRDSHLSNLDQIEKSIIFKPFNLEGDNNAGDNDLDLPRIDICTEGEQRSLDPSDATAQESMDDDGNLYSRKLIKEVMNGLVRCMLDDSTIDISWARTQFGFMKKLRKKRIVEKYVGKDKLVLAAASSDSFECMKEILLEKKKESPPKEKHIVDKFILLLELCSTDSQLKYTMVQVLF